MPPCSLGDESQAGPASTALKSLDERKRLQVVQAVERDSTLLAAALDDSAPSVRQVAARKLAAMVISGLRQPARDRL